MSSDLTPRQRELIDAAVRLLDRRGIEGFTMRSLAAEVGMSAMAAYKHFENQHALQLELWKWCVRDFQEKLALALTDAEGGIARATALSNMFISYAIDTPQRSRLLFLSTFIHEAWKDDDSDAANAGAWGLAFRIFKDGHEDGTLRGDLPPEALFASVYSLLLGSTVLILSGRYRKRAGTPNEVLRANALARVREMVEPRS